MTGRNKTSTCLLIRYSTSQYAVVWHGNLQYALLSVSMPYYIAVYNKILEYILIRRGMLQYVSAYLTILWCDIIWATVNKVSWGSLLNHYHHHHHHHHQVTAIYVLLLLFIIRRKSPSCSRTFYFLECAHAESSTIFGDLVMQTIYSVNIIYLLVWLPNFCICYFI